MKTIVGLIACLFLVACEKKVTLKELQSLKEQKLFHLAHHKAMRNIDDLTKTEKGCAELSEIFLTANKTEDFNLLWEACRLNGHSESYHMIWLLSFILQNNQRYGEAIQMLQNSIDKFEKRLNVLIRMGDLFIMAKNLENGAKLYFAAMNDPGADAPSIGAIFSKMVQTGQWDLCLKSIPLLAEKKVLNPSLYYRVALTAKQNKQAEVQTAFKKLADAQMELIQPEVKKQIQERMKSVIEQL